MSNESVSTFIVILRIVLAFAVLIIVGYACYGGGYQNGQSDALVNRWYFMATEQPDGNVTFAPLVRMSNHPVIAREK